MDAIAGRSLEGVRSVGAVRGCGYRRTAAARDRSPPGLQRNGWAIAGRSLGGRPLRRRREAVWITANHGGEGPQPSRSAPIIIAAKCSDAIPVFGTQVESRFSKALSALICFFDRPRQK